MKIINASVAHLPHGYEMQDILKHIERCGRVCYKSEDKITDTSAEAFIRGIIKRGHEAVLEHGTFIFEVSDRVYDDLKDRIDMLEDETEFVSFLRFTAEWSADRFVVSGNVRAWRDFLKAHHGYKKYLPNYMGDFLERNPLLFSDILENAEISPFELSRAMFKFITPADLVSRLEKLMHWEETFLFVCDRGVSHEIVRHRPAGYCQESTRYCNYGHAGEIAVIEPLYLTPGSPAYYHWENACKVAEHDYCNMLINGCSPQEARAVLPNSLKTEVVMTANMKEWKHFDKLRCAPAAHPQMQEVAKMHLSLVSEIATDLF